MKNLIIIGARGFGREIHNTANQCNEFNKEWVIKGFLDDKADALANFSNYAPIIGPVESYQIAEGDVFCCALGDVNIKKKYVDIILGKGGVFINLIHPSVIMRPNITMGHGIIISMLSVISNEVTIGNFVTIQNHVMVGHDVEIGDWCQINGSVFIGGGCKIRELATINPGTNIMPNKTIGENAVIGIGSVIIRNVKPNTTVFGNPAREI